MRKLLWPALGLLAALALAACNGGGSALPEGTATPQAEAGRVITYDTQDGVRVVAGFAVPEGVENPPVVVLLHQFQGSRRQWDPLVPRLLEAGYAVLAPDLRSFGESTRCFAGAREERCRLNVLDDLVNDVRAALAWLNTQQGVDSGRLAVIGASIGGNLAYVASSFDQVDTAVSMSPNASPGGGVLLGRNVADFSPRSVLFMSDEAEAADARALAEKVAEPVEVKVYAGVTAHGVQLLANPEAVADILDWLGRTL